ncbi:unnamed protein product [Ectocarpus fasciculatus]
MTTEGMSECLDAFIVALDQACDGQEKRWYASTLELQLASLAFCRACRSVQTLHVRVDQQTPPSLWSPLSSQTTANESSGEVLISNRIPAVQAYGATWLRGIWCAERLASVLWLQRLKRLVVDVDTAVNTVSWPASLQRLLFGNSFNQPITGIVLPASLQQLTFGWDFDQPIAEVEWPASLQQLSFKEQF